ncbi:alpha-1,6-glucosidase domain-containing protein [Rivibacter subsaxonicus]|uniref:Pullulanase-type alpha-1,6-glucosidase n=1 Tax=Rivibacter subsaxonicus TaxID=457575 RepID=A0A4Q7VYW8_9BURK|nr:alpha-1,6-glucosidase domain-containing protein [Rivibacter subsaxonicus]RZU01992.1 pullulanase-type alpha-1,6-glucosidase [Rivibacter subsaxonicus]
MRPGARPTAVLASALVLGLAAGAAPAVAAPALADCNSAEHAVLLAPAATTRREARAHWLDRRLLAWPGAPVSGRYRLHHAERGALLAEPGMPVRGADGALTLDIRAEPLPAALAERFAFVGAGARLELAALPPARLQALHRGQLLLVREDDAGRVIEATGLQPAGALDDLYAAAAGLDDLGVVVQRADPRAGAPGSTRFRLWAPSARSVALCLYGKPAGKALSTLPMQWDAHSGSWSARQGVDLSGAYYRYLVEVFVPGVGIVRNAVTDPYAVSLSADSARSYVADLASAALKPPGWDAHTVPQGARAATDQVIYELHVRDFSINDASVPVARRGKYAAFAEAGSAGMRHLRALAAAGLSDVHLLPVFDFGSVPERGCLIPAIPADATADGTTQRNAVKAVAERDCFNWGYDPFHFNAPEGSYASDAEDGAARVIEFRQMVQALHAAGLRVGMDVVYNHTYASGQHPKSVLDRIVPGYYHRLDADGQVERSTCCDNTATEHLMMGKLMLDSVRLWAREYRIDSFRFDLMGHQPRAAMVALKALLAADNGREIHLLGEGWNFGEVADGKRFVQASQLSLGGSGIGTFSDRARDAIRGGGAGDGEQELQSRRGYVTGLNFEDSDQASASIEPLLRAADLVRVGLAGSLRDYELTTHSGERKPLARIDYAGQPAGYASQPGEVVNYVENHDNHTLWDVAAFKLPRGTSSAERARVQMLAAALNMFSQGIAYFHAGIDLLRSKSLDANSYDSGDWFNRIDWSYRQNHFGSGLPPTHGTPAYDALAAPLLRDERLRAQPADIGFARDQFLDLLRIRQSSALLRLPDADAVRARLSFPNSGARQNPRVMAGRLDGRRLDGAGFAELLYLVNVDPRAQTLELPELAGRNYRLHPVHLGENAADRRPRESASYEPASGRFVVPGSSAVVYVVVQ